MTKPVAPPPAMPRAGVRVCNRGSRLQPATTMDLPRSYAGGMHMHMRPAAQCPHVHTTRHSAYAYREHSAYAYRQQASSSVGTVPASAVQPTPWWGGGSAYASRAIGSWNVPMQSPALELQSPDEASAPALRRLQSPALGGSGRTTARGRPTCQRADASPAAAVLWRSVVSASNQRSRSASAGRRISISLPEVRVTSSTSASPGGLGAR